MPWHNLPVKLAMKSGSWLGVLVIIGIIIVHSMFNHASHFLVGINNSTNTGCLIVSTSYMLGLIYNFLWNQMA